MAVEVTAARWASSSPSRSASGSIARRPYAERRWWTCPLERFEELVADALDEIPDDLWRLIDNVAVVVREGTRRLPPARALRGRPAHQARRRLRRHGDARSHHASSAGRSSRMCADEAEVVDQVRITVIHEVAHHFGIDDARLHELGWALSVTLRRAVLAEAAERGRGASSSTSTRTGCTSSSRGCCSSPRWSLGIFLLAWGSTAAAARRRVAAC